QEIFAEQIFVRTHNGFRILGKMQPQGAHDGRPGGRTFANDAVEIRQHAVAQFEIFPADGFHVRVVQLAGIRKRGSSVIVDFGRTGVSGVPSPRETEFPGAAMAAEQGAKGAKLKPAKIELGSKFWRWNKSADICTPIRNSCKGRVEGNGNVSLQGFPCRIHIAGPKKGRIALHAGVGVAMKGVRAHVRPIELRTLPVHAIAHESRGDIEGITLVRPPSVHAHGKVFAMSIPVATCFGFVEARKITSIVYGTAKPVRKNDGMQDGMKVLSMQLVEHFLGIRKNAGVPNEGAILGIPSRRTKPRSQIDERVTRKFLFAEGLRLAQNLFAAGEGAVRLLIAETPERGHLGMAGDVSIFRHDYGGIGRGDDEYIQGKRGAGGLKLSFSSAQVEGAVRVVKKY